MIITDLHLNEAPHRGAGFSQVSHCRLSLPRHPSSCTSFAPPRGRWSHGSAHTVAATHTSMSTLGTNSAALVAICFTPVAAEDNTSQEEGSGMFR